MIDVLKQELPAVPSGGLMTVDVRDVAAAMLAAVEKGQSAKRAGHHLPCVCGDCAR